MSANQKIPSEDEFHAKFLERIGLSSSTDFSNLYGVPINTAQGWLKNGRYPSAYDFLKMAKGDTREAARLCFGAIPKTRAFKLKGMPQPMIKPYSTRENFKKFKMSFEKRPDFAPVKMFRNLAAGYGGGQNYDVVEEAYVYEVPRGGYTIAQIRGDSMVATLNDGEFVLLKDFPAPGYVLPRIESVDEKVPLSQWKTQTKIEDMDIVVVDLDQPEGKTIKRVKYDLRRGPTNWKMLIAADNPLGWQDAWQVEVGDKLTFYGKMIGLCEPI